MSVCEQDTGQILEADARLQYLPLRALAAIHQKTILIMLYDQRGKSALGRGRGGRSTKKKYFKQIDLYC
jgi:hypothetical protein